MPRLRKTQRNKLPLSQRRRPRPSRIKTAPSSPATPAERLELAMELSDFCLALRDAARRKR
jgi:hypothetical protein